MDHQTKEVKPHHEGDKKTVKKPNPWVWILWWQIDPTEMDKQVHGYKTLKFTESIRGISFILLLISVIATVLFVLLLGLDPMALIDAAVLLVVGFLVYKGYRWAMIAAMLLWTFEKGFSLLSYFNTAPTADFNATILIVTILWWTFYMHAFYLAYRVEQARRKKSGEAPAA